MPSSNPNDPPGWAGHVPVEELSRRQGVKPLGSADDLVAPNLMDDEEHAAFLSDLYTSRQAVRA